MPGEERLKSALLHPENVNQAVVAGFERAAQ